MFNDSINNYHLGTFVLEGANLKTGTDPDPEAWCVKY
jgi:hypothetical protein